MAFSVIAAITDLGRQRLASSIVTGKSFQIDQFSVGSGGHDVTDPSTALTPDPSVTSCPATRTSERPSCLLSATSRYGSRPILRRLTFG